jgi:hypothetical protein
MQPRTWRAASACSGLVLGVLAAKALLRAIEEHGTIR